MSRRRSPIATPSCAEPSKGALSEHVALAPELEKALIHFSYARKLSPGEGPALHSAATAKDGVSMLSESAPDVVKVYQALCDYTHPAAPSLFRFGGETQPDTLTFDPKVGPHKLAEIVALSEHVGKVALMLAVAPLVTTLKILNAFARRMVCIRRSRYEWPTIHSEMPLVVIPPGGTNQFNPRVRLFRFSL
jgi:hypothetical protein